MKKKILFVIPSLTSGGGERSLVNLVTQIDYSMYEVDLFMFSHEGLFMELIPKEVNVLPLPNDYRLFTLPLIHSIRKLILKGKVKLSVNRFLFSMKHRRTSNMSIREQYNWKYLAASIFRLDKQYDTAIGFLEKTSIYFCVDKVQAKRRIGWIHTDYDKLGMDPAFDIPYFRKLNHIVTVSDECANIVVNRFPALYDKVNVIHNIISPAVIRDLAQQSDTDLFERSDNRIVILSIGRLTVEKGFELAVEACRMLLDKGYDVHWHIIGDGEEWENLTNLIVHYGVENQFQLLGLKANPYPYLAQADIYVQTSRFEGKSIAVDEAKILAKPIVITRFNTAKDQINDEVDGLIVDMNADAVATGIERLIIDNDLRSRLANRLSDLDLGTEDEINKLYSLMA